MSTPASMVGTDVGASVDTSDIKPELGGSDESATAGHVQLTTAAGATQSHQGQWLPQRRHYDPHWSQTCRLQF